LGPEGETVDLHSLTKQSSANGGDVWRSLMVNLQWIPSFTPEIKTYLMQRETVASGLKTTESRK
jgi:hypothetical protein